MPTALSTASRPGLLTQLSSRVRGRSLDRALAGGTSPIVNPALTARAQYITAPSHRRVLANSLTRVLGASSEDILTARHPGRLLQRGKVLTAESEIRQLADILESPGPVTAQTVALTRLLLSEGGGPLYSRSADAELHSRLSAAISASSV